MPQKTLPISSEDDIRKNKDIAAAGYLWIISLIVLFARKDSHFAQFHAKQGTVLFFLSVVFAIIPGIGVYLNILVLALMVIGFINAAQGEYYKLPVIYDYAAGQKGFHHIMANIRFGLNYIANFFRRLFGKPEKPMSHEKDIEKAETIEDLEEKLDMIRQSMQKDKEMMEKIQKKMQEMKK